MAQAALLPLEIRVNQPGVFSRSINAESNCLPISATRPSPYFCTSKPSPFSPCRCAAAQQQTHAVAQATKRFMQAHTAHACRDNRHIRHLHPGATAMNPCPCRSAAAAATVAAATLILAGVANSTGPQSMPMYQAVRCSVPAPTIRYPSPVTSHLRAAHPATAQLSSFLAAPCTPLPLALKLKCILLSRIRQTHSPRVAGCSLTHPNLLTHSSSLHPHPLLPFVSTLWLSFIQHLAQPPPCWLVPAAPSSA